MDFKRIQLLLFFFFVIFNFYLIYTIREGISGVSVNPNTPVETTIEEELSNRGVTFKEFKDNNPEIPLMKSDQNNYLAENISQLLNQNASIDSNRVLTSVFDQPIDLQIGLSEVVTTLSAEQYETLATTLLSDPTLFIQGTAYSDYLYLPSERAIILKMTDGEGHSIIDGSAELRLQLDDAFMLTGYTQTYQANISYLPEKVTMISEKKAIEILDRRVETYIPNDAQILSTRISYYRSTALNEMNVYTPVWEFIYMEDNGASKALLVDGHRGNVLYRITLKYN